MHVTKFSIPNMENGDDYYKPRQDNIREYTSKILRATTSKFHAYNSYDDHDNDNVKGIMVTTSLIGILHNRI